MNNVVVPQNPGSGPNTGVSFINAASTVPSLNVYDGNVLVNPEPYLYTSGSGGYTTFSAGTHIFHLDSAGSNIPFLSQAETLVTDDLYTMVVYNKPDSTDEVMFFGDNLSNISRQTANIRFLDLCPDLPGGMDVYLGGTEWFPGRFFQDNLQNFALDTFLQVRAGSYNLALKFLAGQQADSLSTRVYFNAGNAYTVYASGFAGSHSGNALRVSLAVNY